MMNDFTALTKKKSATDEWFTPEEPILQLSKILKRGGSNLVSV